MAEDPPDRTGWVTGPLLDLPCEGPFPDFTEFEAHALADAAPNFGEDELRFRQQIANAKVIDRINTFAGFYTRVQVEREACVALKFRQQGGFFDVEGITLGIGIVLWGADGFLETIEGYTMGDSPLAGKILSHLRPSGIVT